MTILIIILKFVGGLLLLFAMEWLLGQLTRLDKHLKY